MHKTAFILTKRSFSSLHCAKLCIKKCLNAINFKRVNKFFLMFW